MAATIWPHLTLDDDWLEQFDSINADAQRLWVTVSLAMASAPPTQRRANTHGGVLVSFGYDRDRDRIDVLTRTKWCVLRYFVHAPRALALHESAAGKLIWARDASGICTQITFAPIRWD